MRRETFPTPEPLRVAIRLPAGRIDLEAVETDETVVELEPLNERGREAVGEAFVELHGNELRVDLEQKRLVFFGRTPEVRVSVRAPLRSSVEIGTAAADVAGRGVFGDVKVKTAAGDIGFDVVEGAAEVNAVSGDVSLGRVAGATALKTVSGDVRLEEAGAGVRAQTVSGDQTLASIREGRVELTSVSGDVRVGIRRGSGVWVDATSVSGETVSELELGDAPPAEGAPVVDLRAKTVSGDIRIERTAPAHEPA